MSRRGSAKAALFYGLTWLIFMALSLKADDSADLKEEVRQLRQQNAGLEKQLQKQQSLLEALARKVGQLQESNLQSQSSQSDSPDKDVPVKTVSSLNSAKLNLSAEGGAGFFRSGRDGMFPNSEFRLDEARLFLEAAVLDKVFFFGELNLATREEPDVQARLGEAYVDFENVSQLWHADHLLNVRFGRMYTPFGEEYQSRYAIDNPFISHSLSDLWAVDEGLELYGRAGRFSYAAAVQNGGIPDTRDFTSDKSLAARISFDPSARLHLSVSGMRTGDIDVHQDQLSALWFGNGFFRSIGSAATTRFHVNLAETDATWQFKRGHLGAFGGYLNYRDNDPLGSNTREVYYYSLEGVHDLFGKLYGGVRFSQVFANRGFPIVGNGDFGDYFFGALTKEIWRLSLDLGYRWSENLVLKAEYTFERGTTVEGDHRNKEDLFALEAAFKF